MRKTRPSRRTGILGIDQLEPRQLLSTAMIRCTDRCCAPHHALRMHHSDRRGSFQSSETVISAAAPATSTGFQVVGQLNGDFKATAAIADNDVWAVGNTVVNGTTQPLVAHFNGTSLTPSPPPPSPREEISTAWMPQPAMTCGQSGPRMSGVPSTL